MAQFGFFLPNLTHLTLDCIRLRERGAEALASSPSMNRVKVLSLDWTYIGDAGVAALATSPYLSSLRVLSLMSNQIGDRGAQALGALQGFHRSADFSWASIQSGTWGRSLFPVLTAGDRRVDRTCLV